MQYHKDNHMRCSILMKTKSIGNIKHKKPDRIGRFIWLFLQGCAAFIFLSLICFQGCNVYAQQKSASQYKFIYKSKLISFNEAYIPPNWLKASIGQYKIPFHCPGHYDSTPDSKVWMWKTNMRIRVYPSHEDAKNAYAAVPQVRSEKPLSFLKLDSVSLGDERMAMITEDLEQYTRVVFYIRYKRALISFTLIGRTITPQSWRPGDPKVLKEKPTPADFQMQASNWFNAALKTIKAQNIDLHRDETPASADSGKSGSGKPSSRSTGNASKEELPPETVLLAVAGGSMVLTLGAFLQLFGMGGLQSLQDIRGTLESLFSFSGADITGTEPGILETQTVQEVEVVPKEPPTLVVPDPIPSGFEYGGKVWYQPPWDKGGPYWMDKSDYAAMRSMMRQGKEWSDRWGWVDPEEGKAMDAQRTAAWDAYKSDTDQDIKTLTANIQDSREKLAEIREKQAELEKIEQLRERLGELERQRELDNSFATQLGDTWDNYVEGVNKDLDALPGELKNMALDAARVVRDTTGALITAAGDTVSDLTNGDNWKAVGKAAVDTAKDLILHPVDSSVRVGNVVKDAGSGVIKAAGVAGNVAVAIVSDPVAFAESVVGIDNWKKVLDPNVPVGERVSRALYGAVDTALNFASGGTKTAAVGVEAGIDALKAADAASDAAKAAKAADTAADTARITAKLDDPARVQAWEAGRMAGQQKADRLAEAIKSGEPSEIKQALVECQKDKHAIGALNRADDSVKHAYNQQMKELITDDVDKVVKEKIAQRYGLDPKDVEIVKPTNPTAKPKVGSDLDFTVKVKAKPGEFVPDPNNPGKFVKVKPGDVLTKDVPVKDAQEIYNRELYSKVTGEPIPTDPEKFKAFQADADKLAHDMDHVAGHRVGAESYGASQQDLEVILQKSGGRFTDPEQAGMVASYKSTHLYQEAENIAKLDPGKAEQFVADGMRQTTKQYGNLIETRVAALQSQGIEAAVDPRLTKAVDILKQVETGGMAPVKAEALLRSQLNMSKDDVANMLGGQLAKLHMMKAK